MILETSRKDEIFSTLVVLMKEIKNGNVNLKYHSGKQLFLHSGRNGNLTFAKIRFVMPSYRRFIHVQ